MVYDCIPFFNELDILKLRLHILDPYVDRFVIEEATVTFSGQPKELCFEKNRELFSEFLHKIDYIVVEDSPAEGTTHERDKFQKNNLMRGLQNLKEEDVIMVSDVDEIPNPAQLQEIIGHFDPDIIYHMAQRMFYCFLNMEEVSGKLLSITGEFEGVVQKKWLGTKIFSVKNIPPTGLIDIREVDVKGSNSVRVEEGGWHFGYMGGRGKTDLSKRIGEKVKAAAHQEYSSQDILAEAADKLILGQDIFGREAEFVRGEIDHSYPAYLRDHKEEYEHLILPPIGKGQAGYVKASMKVKRFFRKAWRKSGRIYAKGAEKVTMPVLGVLSAAALVLSLLPMLALTFINRAAGDDYGYGRLTRQAWVNTHSLGEVAKAVGTTVKQFYNGWQGTWFSISLFSLQPEVFHEKAYVFVTILALVFWVGTVSFVLFFFLVKLLGFRKSSFAVIDALFLMIQMQFIPGIKSSLFWYNGIIHYLLPYGMCLLLVYFLVRYIQTFRWKYFGGILLFMGLLGGSNYQSALFGGIVGGLFLVVGYGKTRKKKCLFLLLPLGAEFTGLFISMKAPGNQVRGGEEFGFSAVRAVETIGWSFVEGIRQIGDYLTEKPVAMIGLVLVLAVILYAQGQAVPQGAAGTGEKTGSAGSSYPYPGMFVLLTFCIYCAMQAPEIYAQTEVSLGVPNINYQTFLWMVLANGVYVWGWCKHRKKGREVTIPGFLIPVGILCVLFMVICRSNLKETTTWKCMVYLTSGQAKDYKEQMDLQTSILLDGSVSDAILPFINDEQGPLMHMPATENPEAYTNSVMRDFYGKNSVVAMDRVEWNRVYGNVERK